MFRQQHHWILIHKQHSQSFYRNDASCKFLLVVSAFLFHIYIIFIPTLTANLTESQKIKSTEVFGIGLSYRSHRMKLVLKFLDNILSNCCKHMVHSLDIQVEHGFFFLKKRDELSSSDNFFKEEINKSQSKPSNLEKGQHFISRKEPSSHVLGRFFAPGPGCCAVHDIPWSLHMHHIYMPHLSGYITGKNVGIKH